MPDNHKPDCPCIICQRARASNEKAEAKKRKHRTECPNDFCECRGWTQEGKP